MENMANKTAKKSKRKNVTLPTPEQAKKSREHPPVGFMANQIRRGKLYCQKNGKIRSDAFVSLGHLVTLNVQKRVQQALHEMLTPPEASKVILFLKM